MKYMLLLTETNQSSSYIKNKGELAQSIMVPPGIMDPVMTL